MGHERVNHDELRPVLRDEVFDLPHVVGEIGRLPLAGWTDLDGERPGDVGPSSFEARADGRRDRVLCGGDEHRSG